MTSGLPTYRTSQFNPRLIPPHPTNIALRTYFRFFASLNVTSKVDTTFLKCEGAELLSSPAPVFDLSKPTS
jgi:hypothetical protein